MTEFHYDIITVGGGLGGSVPAKAMAEQGAVPEAPRTEALPLIAKGPT